MKDPAKPAWTQKLWANKCVCCLKPWCIWQFVTQQQNTNTSSDEGYRDVRPGSFSWNYLYHPSICLHQSWLLSWNSDHSSPLNKDLQWVPGTPQIQGVQLSSLLSSCHGFLLPIVTSPIPSLSFLSTILSHCLSSPKPTGLPLASGYVAPHVALQPPPSPVPTLQFWQHFLFRAFLQACRVSQGLGFAPQSSIIVFVTCVVTTSLLPF